MIFRRSAARPGLLTGRIEAFSDGVFAIAITLLILEIAVPELSSAQLSQGVLLQKLVELLPKFVSFIISFSIISIFWVGHTIMFHFIARSDRKLLWLNSLVLMSVAFIPFPAALIGRYAPDTTAVVLYGATLVVAGILFALTWHHASTDRRLLDEKTPERVVRLGRKVILIAPITYAIAVAIAFVAPVVSIVIYVLVPFAYILPSPIDDIVDAAAFE